MLPPPPSAFHTVGRVFQPRPPAVNTVNNPSQQQPKSQSQLPVLRSVAEILSLNRSVYLGCILHRYNANLRDIHHFRALVAHHEALKASVKPPVISKSYPVCSGCIENLQRRSLSKQKPNVNALFLAIYLERKLKCPQVPRQAEAVGRFLTLLDDRSPAGLLSRLGAEDARGVSRTEYIYLLDNLTAMLIMPSNNIRFNFDFLPELDSDKASNGILGQCGWVVENGRLRVRVRISPMRVKTGVAAPKGSVLNPISMSRLSTLLHEICHAFLLVYACQDCPGYTADVKQLRGHGFAWQRVAFAVEFAAWKTLGLKFRLGRFSAIGTNWQDLREWPSQQEVERWMLFWENLQTSQTHLGAVGDTPVSDLSVESR